jgi:hypothetical protein
VGRGFSTVYRTKWRFVEGNLERALSEGGAFLARLEPYGMIILIAALLILPVLGAQMDVDLNHPDHRPGQNHHPRHCLAAGGARPPPTTAPTASRAAHGYEATREAAMAAFK